MQKRRSGDISSYIFETYKNDVQQHSFHSYNTTADMDMETMCNCTSKNHEIPHWKYVFRCCDKYPSIVLPSNEENKDTKNSCTTIRFYVYRNVSCFNVHG